MNIETVIEYVIRIGFAAIACFIFGGVIHAAKEFIEIYKAGECDLFYMLLIALVCLAAICVGILLWVCAFFINFKIIL